MSWEWEEAAIAGKLKYLGEYLLPLSEPRVFPPCSPQCLDSSIGTLSFGLKHVSLQGNADVNEFIRSLPWGFQAGARDRIGRKFGDTERYTEGTWRLWKGSSSFFKYSLGHWIRAEAGKRVGRILDLRVLSKTGLSRPSSNQSYMDPSGKAQVPFCAFSQAIPTRLTPWTASACPSAFLLQINFHYWGLGKCGDRFWWHIKQSGGRWSQAFSARGEALVVPSMLPLQSEPVLGKVTVSCGKSEAGFVAWFPTSGADTGAGCGTGGSSDPCAWVCRGFQDCTP